MNKVPLSVYDSEIYDIIEREKNRQWRGLELIASENFTSSYVLECLGSCLTNKYAEGTIGARYYGGSEEVDKIEKVCIQRALQAFNLKHDEWGVNVQPYSGSPANFAVYTGLLKPHDRIMGLDLPSGGHLTHGFYTFSKKEGVRKPVSATSVYFESLPYKVKQTTGLIDYDSLERDALLFKPELIICGGSAYSREWDYERLRNIADQNGSILLCDMAHISGLVATGEAKNPFDYCDVVTSTTHKSLRGPRSGMIFYRKDSRNFETKINNAVFPALQGGPHMHQIAALATQLKEVQTLDFKNYIKQVKNNSKALTNRLIELGHTIASGGTDNHLCLWDLKPHNITGSKFEKLCDAINITLNKNCVPGDKSAITPGGVRLGTCALTTRTFKEIDFIKIADLLNDAIKLAITIQKSSGTKLVDFINAIDNNKEVNKLKESVNEFATKFPIPGFNYEDMKYKSIYGPKKI